MTRFDKVCFISARNLGDAVLHADMVRRLHAAGFARRWVVWTSAQAAFVFEGLPDCEIVRAEFPSGATSRSFLKGGYRAFLRSVKQLRAMKFDATLDVVGDFRERLACRLLGAPVNFSPEWETGHPFRAHNMVLPFKAGRPLSIPVSVPNLYDAQALMVDTLAPGAGAVPRRPRPTDGEAHRFGIHPFASAPFKLWPEARWIELCTQLDIRYPGSRYLLFGAPADRPALAQLAARLPVPVELATGSLKDFQQHIAGIDLLFGLDSFSVHMAHSQGTPSVVLVGANDPRLFTPPSARAVTHPGQCSFQPCGGRPRCVGTDFQYSCMSAIDAFDALGAANDLLHRQDSAASSPTPHSHDVALPEKPARAH